MWLSSIAKQVGSVPRRRKKTVRPQLEVLEERAVPTTFNWIGAVDGSWRNGDNWLDLDTGATGVTPPQGSDLNFPFFVNIIPPGDNDFDVGYQFNSLTFEAGYTINGTQISLLPNPNGSIIVDDGVTVTLNVPLALEANSQVQDSHFNVVKGKLVLGSPISDSQITPGFFPSVVKDGPGDMDLTSNNLTYTGRTQVTDGALLLDIPNATFPLPGPVVIGDGVGAGNSAVLRDVAAATALETLHEVTIYADGKFDLNQHDLQVISLTSNPALTMTGGEVETEGNKLTLGSGGVKVHAPQGGGSSVIGGHLELSFPSNTFSIDGGTSLDLQAALQVQNIGVPIDMNVGGTLQLDSFAGPNSITGKLTLSVGTLELIQGGAPGDLVINGGTVLDENDGQLNGVAVASARLGGVAIDLQGHKDHVGLLTFTGGPTIANGTLTLDDNVTANAAGGQVPVIFDCTLDLGTTTHTFTTNANGNILAQITVQGDINGGNGSKLIKDGPGKLVLNGDVSLEEVSLIGGTLAGEGRIDATAKTNDSTTAVTIAPGSDGILTPGDSTANTLGFSVLSLNSNATVQFHIGGPNFLTDYTNLLVPGSIDLAGSHLDVQLVSNYTPKIGDSFEIIGTNGTGTLFGTFIGLPEGATLSVGGATLQVSYLNNDVQLTAVAAPPATHLNFFVQPTETTADQNISPAVQVEIDDAAGHRVTTDNSTVVTIAAGTHPPGGAIGGQLTATAHNGVATFDTLGSTTAGEWTLIASAGSLTPATSDPFPIDPGPIGQLVFTPQPTDHDTVSPLSPPIVVAVEDSFGNLLTINDTTHLMTLSLGQNPTGATLGGTTQVPISNGLATFSDLMIQTPGTYTLRADDFGIQMDSNAFQITAPAAATQFSVSVPSSVTAGTPFDVTVTALDSSGNPFTGYTGTVHFMSTDDFGTLPADFTFSAGDMGTHTFVGGVTPTIAGTHTMTVTDTAQSKISGTATYTVNPGPAVAFRVDVPTTVTARTPFTVTVTAFDADPAVTDVFNVATGYTGTIHFKSTDFYGTLPADFTFAPGDMGTHTFTSGVTLHTAGTQTITVADTAQGGILFKTADVAVDPGPAAFLKVTAPGTAAAGTPFNVTVTAYDAVPTPSDVSNVVTGFSDVIHFLSTDEKATLPFATKLTAGTGTFSVVLRTGGNQSVSVNDSVIASLGNSAAVTVTTSGGGGTSMGFVGQLYQDLLHRDADAAGANAWTAMLARGVPRTQVALDFVHSTEYRTNAVQSLYQENLNRGADAPGMNAALAFLSVGGSMEALKTTMLGSTEYFQMHGGTNSGFLAALYPTLFGRSIDPVGEQLLSQALAKGYSRSSLVGLLMQSDEAERHVIDSLYQQFLRRPADNIGLAITLSALRQGLHQDGLIADLTGSQEYFVRL